MLPWFRISGIIFVRKHTMLERALRHYDHKDYQEQDKCVRKHTMLERALRPEALGRQRLVGFLGQKAYNAREGIETHFIP